MRKFLDLVNLDRQTHPKCELHHSMGWTELNMEVSCAPASLSCLSAPPQALTIMMDCILKL